jgi:hypothetical protein
LDGTPPQVQCTARDKEKALLVAGAAGPARASRAAGKAAAAGGPAASGPLHTPWRAGPRRRFVHVLFMVPLQ